MTIRFLWIMDSVIDVVLGCFYSQNPWILEYQAIVPSIAAINVPRTLGPTRLPSKLISSYGMVHDSHALQVVILQFAMINYRRVCLLLDKPH